MSDQANAGPWPVLDPHERRVLGVLVEKGKTTPDAYPMSLNAVVTGSNQKTNREPVLELDEWEVEEALRRCKERGLVAKVIGGRVERHRHLLYEAWKLDKVELAVVGELLLRGPQTEGELRTRASRMDPIEDLDVLRALLKPLIQRNLVLYLTPEDRRGAILTHGFHSAAELERARRLAASAPVPAEPSRAPMTPAPPTRPMVAAPAMAPAPVAPRPDERVAELVQAVAALRAKVESLEKGAAETRAELTATKVELAALRQSLGG